MKKIGLLSDTHGMFDGRLEEFFANVDELWHAGDIGTVELADRLAAFKPLRAVYGNIDGSVMRRMFPLFGEFMCEDMKVLMTHIGGYPGHYNPRARQKIEQTRPAIFISGHSHILKVIFDKKYGLLHINPGAAGNHGFHHVRTAIRFVIEGDSVSELEVGEWTRH